MLEIYQTLKSWNRDNLFTNYGNSYCTPVLLHSQFFKVWTDEKGSALMTQ